MVSNRYYPQNFVSKLQFVEVLFELGVQGLDVILQWQST